MCRIGNVESKSRSCQCPPARYRHKSSHTSKSEQPHQYILYKKSWQKLDKAAQLRYGTNRSRSHFLPCVTLADIVPMKLRPRFRFAVARASWLSATSLFGHPNRAQPRQVYKYATACARVQLAAKKKLMLGKRQYLFYSGTNPGFL